MGKFFIETTLIWWNIRRTSPREKSLMKIAHAVFPCMLERFIIHGYISSLTLYFTTQPNKWQPSMKNSPRLKWAINMTKKVSIYTSTLINRDINIKDTNTIFIWNNLYLTNLRLTVKEWQDISFIHKKCDIVDEMDLFGWQYRHFLWIFFRNEI